MDGIPALTMTCSTAVPITWLKWVRTWGLKMGTTRRIWVVRPSCMWSTMVCATKIQLTTSKCSTDVSEITAELRQHGLHATTSEAVLVMLAGVHGGYVS